MSAETESPGQAAEARGGERRIARSISELPPLPPEHIRVVHITRPEAAEDIARGGLSYRGELYSTARGWGDAQQCEFSTDDSRFSFEGAVAVVMDVPFDVVRLHNDVTKSPGLLPAEYVVGIVESRPSVESSDGESK